MNDSAIKILKENNLFDEKESYEINLNKFENFLKTYSFNEGISSMPKRLKRDEYGYILLDEIPYIESNINIFKTNKNMHNDCTWILLNNGSKILLKEDNHWNILYYELLSTEFLKTVGLNTADYDGAIINNTKYIITPSFLKHNEKIFNPLSNASYLITSYKDCKKYNIGDFYLKTIFADYIYGNADRSRNFGIIKNNNEYKNAILFDNGEVSLERTSDSFPYINNDNSMDFIINYLLNYEVIVNWLKTDLKKYNLYSCTNKIEKKKKMYIPSYIYREFETFFKDSEDIINDELKSKGINLKIKLT